jgi:5-methylcytosine-specific restriction endonuclease McrA
MPDMRWGGDCSLTIKNRNGGTQTESQFFSGLRSALRRHYRYWKPLIAAKYKARREYKGGGRQKWEYQCNSCDGWFPDKQVEVDHIIPVGSLKTFDDLIPFIERLIPEDSDSFQVLCKECHKKKTAKEREDRKVK